MAPRRLAPVEIQPKSFAFSAKNLEWARAELTKYPQGRQESAIVSLLWRAQHTHHLYADESVSLRTE